MSSTKTDSKRNNFPTVCIVGAGIGGMCAGIQLKRKLNIHSFVIIEKNHDIGGVWLSNTYPGVACDIPSYSYSYSFARTIKWSKLFAGQEEIWNYLRNVAEQYELYSHIRFNTSVKSMHWNENKNKWIVTTVNDNGINCVEEYDIVILATGALREPNKPAIYDAFTGPMMHSAEWNKTIRLENKVVGIVGVGASAVQIVPKIASKTKELIVYQRTAQYIVPRPQIRIPWLLKLFFGIPGTQCLMANWIFTLTHQVTSASITKGSFTNKLSTKLVEFYRWIKIKKDKNLRNQLTPISPYGAKCPCVTSKFYPTLQKPNVKLVTEDIFSINGNIITTTNGENKELDVLILCTGFKSQDFFAPIEIIGTNGINVLEKWKQAWPRTYYGVTSHSTPNMFFLLGPNSFTYTSHIFIIEWQCKFLVNIIGKMVKKELHFIQVKKSVEDECWEEISSAMKKTVLDTSDGACCCYLTNEIGENTLMWPKKPSDYRRKLRHVDLENFNTA